MANQLLGILRQKLQLLLCFHCSAPTSPPWSKVEDRWPVQLLTLSFCFFISLLQMKSCLSYATIAVVLLVVGFQRTKANCLDECFDKWQFCRIGCGTDPCASVCETNYRNCTLVCPRAPSPRRRLYLYTKMNPSLKKNAKIRHV